MTLRELREENGKTCAEVAQVLGIANSSYYNYEQGTRQINIKQVLLIAEMFDCSEKEVIQAQLSSCRISQ